MIQVRRMLWILLADLLGTSPAVADDMLEGWARRGAVYDRIDLDGGSPLACAALCREDRQCRSWVWTQSAVTGSYESCALLSATPTAYRAPGQVTGLSPVIADRLDAAMDRPPSAREEQALADVAASPH